MAESEREKARSIQIRSPNYVHDRNNDLRINRETAERIIARCLRDKMSPGEANEMAEEICKSIVASMPMPGRPSLRGWRMIPESPPWESRAQVAREFRSVRADEDDNWFAESIWRVVYGCGQNLPDDVVV